MLQKITEEIRGLSIALREEVLPVLERQASELLDHLDLGLWEVSYTIDGVPSCETIVICSYTREQAIKLLENYFKGRETSKKLKLRAEPLSCKYLVDDEYLDSLLSESDQPRILLTILK